MGTPGSRAAGRLERRGARGVAERAAPAGHRTEGHAGRAWDRASAPGRLMAFAVAVFAAVLAVIASERVDRTKVALVGAVLFLLTQTIDQETAVEAIDW